MNNSIFLEDVNIIYTPVLLLMWHTWTHNSYKFSLLDRYRGGQDHVFCEVRNLLHIFWGIWCAVWWPWCSCVLSLGMWYVMGTSVCWESWDVTPWGLVDRPKQFGGTWCPLFRMQNFFPSNPEDGNARFHQDVGTCVSDTAASHTVNL